MNRPNKITYNCLTLQKSEMNRKLEMFIDRSWINFQVENIPAMQMKLWYGMGILIMIPKMDIISAYNKRNMKNRDKKENCYNS